MEPEGESAGALGSHCNIRLSLVCYVIFDVTFPERHTGPCQVITVHRLQLTVPKTLAYLYTVSFALGFAYQLNEIRLLISQ
jgi:hypothetical protein